MKNLKAATLNSNQAVGVIARFPWKVAAVFLFFFVAASFLVCFEKKSEWQADFVVGEPSPKTFFAPISIELIDREKTEALRLEKAKEVPSVLRIRQSVQEEALAKLQTFLDWIERKKSSDQASLEGDEIPLEISDQTIRFLVSKDSSLVVKEWTSRILNSVFEKGILNETDMMDMMDIRGEMVSFIGNEEKTQKTVPLREILVRRDLDSFFRAQFPELFSLSRGLRNSILDVVYSLVAANLQQDHDETLKRQKKASAEVSEVTEKIKKDQLVIQRGVLITPEKQVRLEAIQKAVSQQRVINHFLGGLLVMAIMYALFFLYLHFFDPKSLSSMRMLLLIHSVILVSIALCKLAILWRSGQEFLMPTALASVLLVLLANRRYGLLCASLFTGVAALLTDGAPAIMTGTLFSGIAATYAALQVRRRIQFLRIALACGGAYAGILAAFALVQDLSFSEALRESIFGMINGVLVVGLAFILLPVFESVFDRVTDISLLELSDLNHPLLKRMMIEAPGTYHHSLSVSVLAESASQAVGANSLLARVGSYYHDIGKIPQSEYFTENQRDPSQSKHTRIVPSMSSAIIRNHVKNGIELGIQYKIKKRILQFIPEHQGTGIIYFFYRKAIENAAPDEKINPDDFRYLGPKPQSRETAIVMLADSTEAAARSLKEPTEESIRNIVRKIINDKFIDGQLDECELTLSDLHKIQESFIHNLQAVFHTRVSYPTAQPASDQPNLFQALWLGEKKPGN